MSEKNKCSNKDLRVIYRRMVYCFGIPTNVSEKMLASEEYFGQYGNVTRIVLLGPTKNKNYISVYITFEKQLEAAMAILSTNDLLVEGNLLKSMFGTVKYCHFFLKKIQCKNDQCPFYHVMDKKNQTNIKDNVDDAIYQHYLKAKEILINKEANKIKWKNSRGILPSPYQTIKKLYPKNQQINQKIVLMLLKQFQNSNTSKYLKNKNAKECPTTKSKIQQYLRKYTLEQ